MNDGRFRVGIVGLQAGRSWAWHAHIPALRALSEHFEIAGVANTTLESAQAAASASGIPNAHADYLDLVRSSDIDVVTVTVKVPHHLAIVEAAIQAGKHVYCEWPLGNGLAEAESMASSAAAAGILGVIGSQARAAPEILYLRQLLDDGYVGDVLSTTVTGRGTDANSPGRGWGPTTAVESIDSYLMNRANGATLLTIPLGHTLAAIRDVLGDFSELSALIANRRTSVVALDTGANIPKSAPDQILISGTLASGAPISVHYRGGPPRHALGFTWEINGTEGDILVTAPSGHTQMVQLSLQGARGDERAMRALPVPDRYRPALSPDPIVGNVACIYAQMAADLRNGTRIAPSFQDAVNLHRLIAAIEGAAAEGGRIQFSPAGE